ncbi:molybdopterin molybdotransferase MoeA [Neisseria zoodegmatis]|uniref:Molybdopterin molybdenumtransferase n=1 Tax=Neisseria zoodegmatis TaxID=326523 RepID=A0AB38DRD5_9NEIS|nr:gephyrin-like molybdotransferase Glp [Neisseria zoodegmatis]OSI11485.1 molybdopterin molybdenumtransferase MoeA [Neisseria zoodegmatis]SNU79965.1 Molybdopterin molybdenumtransferase [Neisseria zoodegmatis]
MSLTSVTELQTLIRAHIDKSKYRPEIETVAVACAAGRVLAQDITSPLNIPCADISAMDGYTLPAAAEAGSRWQVAGESAAGKPFADNVPEGGCVRIMTGAVVPTGGACVVLKENVTVEENSIVLNQAARAGDNIRYCGEEVAIGNTVLQAGRILRTADIMLLAALGVGEVPVYRKIKVAVLSTGDELHEPGTPVGRSDQVYDSNRHTLMARLNLLPVEVLDLGQAADDLEGVLHVLDEAAQQADVVITSGGVSVGDYDYVREAVLRLGAIHHYKVAVKPGKPFVFGKMLNTWYFGLPGNPVSGFVGFDLFIKEALWLLCGATDVPQPLRFSAVLTQPVKKSPGRTDIQRALLQQEADGSWSAAPSGAQDSHRVWGVSRANGYMILPCEAGDLPAGTLVTVQPFTEAFL